MPLVDRRTNSVVLRIVYDGPPEAGKTTNLKELCERLSLGRRGALDHPGGDERTQFFDWLDVTGGWVGGHRVRCQLVMVPGQIQLARRRRYILDSADVVVFVADSRAGAAPEALAALRSLARALTSRGQLPLLLQANKQDLPGARAPGELHRAFDLDERVPVIAAQASAGIGVVETFMLAVRLAVDHVRSLLVAGQLGEGDATSAAELLAALEAEPPEAMRGLDALSDAADPLAPRAPAPIEVAISDAIPIAAGDGRRYVGGMWPRATGAPAPAVVARALPAIDERARARVREVAAEPSDLLWEAEEPEPEPRAAEPEPRAAGPEPRAAGPEPRAAGPEPRAAVPELPPLRITPGQPHPAPLGLPPPPDPLPFHLPPIDLPAGLVWPGVSGRVALAALASPLRMASAAASWAPAGAIELECADGWLAHTSPELVFADLERGRIKLFEAVRWQAGMAGLTPANRTYALAPEDDRARLWIMTPRQRTAWDLIEEAFAARDRTAASRSARRSLAMLDEIRERGFAVADLDHIGAGEPPRLLTTPWTLLVDRLPAQLQRLFDAAVL